MNGDSVWTTNRTTRNGNDITETRTTNITGKVINRTPNTVSANELAGSLNARLNAQGGTESYTNADGGTTTIVYKTVAKFEGVTSMDQVGKSDHLVAVVGDATGQADPALGGGPAGGVANIGGKVAYVEAGSGLAGLTNMAFHEVGHTLGLAHPGTNNRNDPMSYTGQNANFSTGQLRNVYLNANEGLLNQGPNSMRIGNQRVIYNPVSTDLRPYIGNRTPGMVVPLPTRYIKP